MVYTADHLSRQKYHINEKLDEISKKIEKTQDICAQSLSKNYDYQEVSFKKKACRLSSFNKLKFNLRLKLKLEMFELIDI